VASETKYRDSIRVAVSKSTSAPSTAALMIARGAGYGAPFSCLRRFAGNAGRNAASFGDDGVPPGILYPSRSQGCLASPSKFLTQLYAVSSSWSLGTTSSITPTDRACAGFIRCPCSSTFISASCRPSIRVTRVTPPAPGSSPSVTSGTPISYEPSAAIRW
jgi:hypothetical protein